MFMLIWVSIFFGTYTSQSSPSPFDVTLQIKNGTFETCMPRSFYQDLGIVIGDRSNVRPVIFSNPIWNSGAIVNDVIAILMQEAMGFKGTYRAQNEFDESLDLLDNEEVDLIAEARFDLNAVDKDSETLGNYLPVGITGYTGQTGMFATNAVWNASYFTFGGSKYINCGENKNCMDRYMFQNSADFIDYMTIHDPITQMINNVDGLADEMASRCSRYTPLPALIFLPEQCAPIPRGNSNITYPDGFEDVDVLLYTGETIHLDTANYILPPCTAWNDINPMWHANLYQSLLQNLGIKARLYFWSWCRPGILIEHFHKYNKPYIFFVNTPTYLDIDLQTTRQIQFDSFKEGCFETNQSNIHGAYSPNTCGTIGAMENFMILGSYVWTQIEARDAMTFFARFDFAEDHIVDLLKESIELLRFFGTASYFEDRRHFDVACAWVQNNTDIWMKWLPEEQYLPVIHPSDSSGMTTLEIIISIVATIALVLIAAFYIVNKNNLLQFLKDIGNDMLDIAAGRMFQMVFSWFDFATDILNFILVINKQDVSFSFRLIYIICLIISLLIILYMMKQDYVILKEIFCFKSRARTNQRKQLSITKHSQFKLSLQKDNTIVTALVLMFEDVPMLVLNLIFTIVIAAENADHILNLLAILSGSLSLGMKFSSLVERRLARAKEKQMKSDLRFSMMMAECETCDSESVVGTDGSTVMTDASAFTFIGGAAFNQAIFSSPPDINSEFKPEPP